MRFWPFAKRSIENPRHPVSWNGAFATLLGWSHSAAGVTVTREVALGVPAIWAAVNFIAGTIASLPLQVFKRTDKGREKAERDPLYALLHDAPNDEWSSFAWRKHAMVGVLVGGGRAYTFIERNKAGRVMNLWPLDPDRMTVRRAEGRKVYLYKDADQAKTYQASEIIDVPFLLSGDGLGHHDPVVRLRNTIGLAVALEEYASKFFQNGGVPPLSLQGPITSVQGAKRAAADITDALRQARDEQRNVLVMPQGHELKPIGVDPEKSQLVPAQRFIIEQVARMYNLSPIFLQDLTHGTFSNTEQQDLHVVKHTITQWLKAWEQEMNLKLFSARNRVNFVEFNVDGLLRGDFKSRMEAEATSIQNAIRTPNEVRDLENLPPMKGGDDLMIQGATVPIGQQPKPDAEPAPKDTQAKEANDDPEA